MFTRDDTKIIKGAAIILMLIHHLWGLPERIAGGSLKYMFTIFGQSSIVYFGLFGKICVSLFFFVGGYGMYIASQNGRLDIINKLKMLYISYWKVFVLFIPMGFLFFSCQPIYCEDSNICNRYAEFQWGEFLQNFLGLRTTYNSEWWFLKSYVYAIISFPLVKKICDKYTAITNFTIIIIGSIMVTNVFPALGNIESIGKLNNNFLYQAFFCQRAPYIACFWVGGGYGEGWAFD